MSDSPFSAAARRTLVDAYMEARSMGHSCLGSEHILLALCMGGEERTARILAGRGITAERVRSHFGAAGQESSFAAEMTREAAQVLELAARLAGEAAGSGIILPEHILGAIARTTGCGGYSLLRELNADPEEILSDLRCPVMPPKVRKPRSSEPKLLSQFGVDMTAKAKKGEYDPLIGREKELERVMRILCRRRKANPVLLGEAGVGKTAIVEGLARAIALGQVPSPLRDMHLYALDMATVVAGTKYRGEFEEKVRGLLAEACGCGDVVLFIDELHTIAGAGAAEGAIDAGNILKPALARGELRILGATTPAEYRKYIEKDGALERRFQPVDVGEPDRASTMAILRSSAALCRRHYGIEAGEDLLGNIERLCVRYLPDRHFPDKAIDVLDEASAMALTEGTGRVEEWHIRRVVSQMSGLDTLLEAVPIDPAGMEARLQAKVIGQSEAVHDAVSAVAAAMAFPGSRTRPQGVMLFCGASGTGKTLLAKALAEEVFGDGQALRRFDMSEYREPYSISRLIGASPGYQGYGSGGLLTEAVRRRPFSVLLFDEVEKAHPEVLGLLLQLLEDGVLTDSEGRKADFRSAIILLTTNVGSKPIPSVGFGSRDRDGVLRRALGDVFPPELLGRIDHILHFRSLDADRRTIIATRLLEEFAENLAQEEITLHWSEELPQHIAAHAESGRDVRTLLHREVEEPTARLCLGQKRGMTLYADCRGGKVTVEIGAVV